jgi:hypothetical protein
MPGTDSNIENEIWKAVVGFESLYSVSNLGRIRREAPPRWQGRGKTFRGRILNGTNMQGYRQVRLTRTTEDRYLCRIHRLVAAAFLGPCPETFEVNHRNGRKSDNRLENLEYVSRSDNLRHAYAIGLRHPVQLCGEASGVTHLTAADVTEMRRLWREGVTQYQLAERFSISQPTVSEICNYKNWRSVP